MITTNREQMGMIALSYIIAYIRENYSVYLSESQIETVANVLIGRRANKNIWWDFTLSDGTVIDHESIVFQIGMKGGHNKVEKYDHIIRAIIKQLLNK